MKKKNIILAIVSTLIFIIYTVLLINVDVKPIGPNDSSVGFAKMNGWFRDLIGQNNFMYKLSEILGILILLFVVIYACIGLYQLIKRKNLFKIDREIIILGCFYVVVFALYIIFSLAIAVFIKIGEFWNSPSVSKSESLNVTATIISFSKPSILL